LENIYLEFEVYLAKLLAMPCHWPCSAEAIQGHTRLQIRNEYQKPAMPVEASGRAISGPV